MHSHVYIHVHIKLYDMIMDKTNLQKNQMLSLKGAYVKVHIMCIGDCLATLTRLYYKFHIDCELVNLRNLISPLDKSTF